MGEFALQRFALTRIATILAFTAPIALGSPARAEAPADGPDRAFVLALQLLDSHEPTQVLSRLTPESIEYFDGLRIHALASDRTALSELSIADRLVVLALRHELTRDGIRQPVPDLLSSQLARLQQPTDWQRAAIGPQFEYRGAQRAPLLIDGIPTGFVVDFMQRDGRWLVDLRHSAALFEPMIRMQSALTGVTQDEAIVSVLARLSQRPVRSDIWNPGASPR